MSLRANRTWGSRMLALSLGCVVAASCDVHSPRHASDLEASIRAICDAQAGVRTDVARESPLATFIATTPIPSLPNRSLSWCVGKAIAADSTAMGSVYEFASGTAKSESEYLLIAKSSSSVTGERGLALGSICRAAQELARQGFDLVEMSRPQALDAAATGSDLELYFMRSRFIAPDAAAAESASLRARSVRVDDHEWLLFWIGPDPKASAVWSKLLTIAP